MSSALSWDRRKLADYCLDPSHPVGRHKALVFQRALGWTADDADQLSQLLLRAALVEDAVIGQLDEFGQRYVVDFVATTVAGAANIRSAWIIRSGEEFPRLTTCFVLSQ